MLHMPQMLRLVHDQGTPLAADWLHAAAESVTISMLQQGSASAQMHTILSSLAHRHAASCCRFPVPVSAASLLGCGRSMPAVADFA